MSSKLFVRGSNILGECGLGKKVVNTGGKFIENFNIPDGIKQIESNMGGNYLLSSDSKTVYYFGFKWDLRSYIRINNTYPKFPRLFELLKKIWHPLKCFPTNVCILGQFDKKIIQMEVGGSFGIVLDEDGNVFVIGENEKFQLGTTLPNTSFTFSKLNLETKIVKIAAGFQHTVLLGGKIKDKFNI